MVFGRCSNASPDFIGEVDDAVKDAYALKPDFSGRVTLLPRRRADGSGSTFGTRTKPIWGPQRVELALALDRAGLDARLFLRGYELVASAAMWRSSESRAELVARNRPGGVTTIGDRGRGRSDRR